METPTAEPKSKLIKDFPPIEQWDQVAAKLIYDELAPKGFKKFTKGHWRGATHADIPFLSKKQVGACQKIGSQLVRTYRSELKAQVEQRIDEVKKLEGIAIKLRDETAFWQFRRRREFQREYEHYRDQGGLLTIVLGWIDQTKVPSK